MWVSMDRVIKCALVERLNRTLRTKLLKKFTASQSENWVHTLPALVANYNRTRHSAHGLAPEQVDGPEQTLRAQIKLYPRTAKPENTLAVGQLVRLSRIREKFEKDSYRYTLALWRVTKVIKRQPASVYEVSDIHGAPVEGRFYREELLPVRWSPVDR